MLQPKKTKFRKTQKGRIKGLSTRGSSLSFGTYGVKALEKAFISNRQIESARVIISRALSKGSKMWIRIFP
ncbi:MAG: 50S ribosomal protein L16, partial [Phocaeicola sp.]